MSVATTPARGSVLIEGHNLMLPTGTGIATYARVLGDTVAGLGYAPHVLVGTPQGLDRSDPMLSEVNFFDASRKSSLAHSIGTAWRYVTEPPWGARAFELPRSGIVVGAATEKLASFQKVYAVPHLQIRELAHFRRYGRMLGIETDQPPTLFHATRPAPIRVARAPNVYTVHDVVPLRLPHATADDKRFHLRMLRELCRTADHVVTVSEFSRADIIALTGIDERRITNTYQAVALPPKLVERPEADVVRELEAAFRLGFKDYFLFVGAIEPKKNLSRLIDAYAASGVRRPLIIAGGLGWFYDTDVAKMRDERFLTYDFDGSHVVPRRAVRHLSYVPFSQLVSLMRGARALLFPSIYEGFGLPVLEAMSLGTPVMTSNVSSLPEVAGGAAHLVDPYDIDNIAAAIRTIDTDTDLRADLAVRGRQRSMFFSAAAYQRRLGEVYARVA